MAREAPQQLQSLIGLETIAGLIMLAVKWSLAVVFPRSGLGKTTGLAQFRAAVANYQLPTLLVTPVTYSLPFAEIAAAILLALGILSLQPTVWLQRCSAASGRQRLSGGLGRLFVRVWPVDGSTTRPGSGRIVGELVWVSSGG